MDVEPILRFLGLSGGPALLGAFMIRAFWNADEIVRAESRPGFGAYSRSFWSAELIRFDYFKHFYDAVFATQRSCRPGLIRFGLITPILIGLIGALLWSLQPSYFVRDMDGVVEHLPPFLQHAVVGGIAIALLNIVFLSIPNFLLDYLSAWQSRAFMSLLGKSIWAVPLVLVASLACSVLLWLLGWAVLIGLFGVHAGLLLDLGLLHHVWTAVTGGALFADIQDAWNAFALGRITDENAGIWSLAVSLLATAVVSMWLWLYAASLCVWGVIKIISTPLQPIFGALDFESTPLRINGLIIGVILILVGIALALIDRFA